MASPKAQSVAQIDVTPLPTHERTKLSSRPDLKNIKHPSTIKLISVVKTTEAPPEDDQWIGLTKYELLEFINDPFWVRMRSVIISLFITSFFCIFLAAILIIIYSPKCEGGGTGGNLTWINSTETNSTERNSTWINPT